MIYSVFQCGVRNRILGIVNEKNIIDARLAANARFGHRDDYRISLDVKPGLTQANDEEVPPLLLQLPANIQFC